MLRIIPHLPVSQRKPFPKANWLRLAGTTTGLPMSISVGILSIYFEGRFIRCLFPDDLKKNAEIERKGTHSICSPSFIGRSGFGCFGWLQSNCASLIGRR
ncbi:unnamed protein product [Ilex paraguariensis]|uniref:Uncharacterized protein n=1 Tax=Ilex paraguariensis TaxID=185542 RepID=A0ABC8SIC3_9AQUA